MPKQKIKPGIDADYAQVNESDVKHAIEVPVKQIDEASLITVEKQGKVKKLGRLKSRSVREDLAGEKVRKIKTREIKESQEEVETETSVRRNGYTLIITEKPQAALKIASALGRARKLNEHGAPYYELERGGKKIVVACAVGHLFSLESKEKGWPIFNISWVPSFKKSAWTKKYYSLLGKLVKGAGEFILATDYDIEGEVIGWNIIRFIAKQKDAFRMKYSTLTSAELQKSYENLMPTIDWGQAIAGETRHFLDWMYGINLSRALMEAIKKAGSFRIMSVGRVQGPALKLIVDKELEILRFKAEPYFQVFIKLLGHEVELKYEKDIFDVRDARGISEHPEVPNSTQGLLDKKLLKEFENINGKKGQAVTENSKRNVIPPMPFDLTSLQREAYRLFGINPAKTLQLAQGLYLAGVISYPRTSSQKIPDAIEPKKILKRLAENFKEVSLAKRDKPVEGNKSDPAHPSIYPTGEIMDLQGEEAKIYNLVVKRFISCFCEDAEVANKKVVFTTEEKRFLAFGLEILKKGWMEVYPMAMKEQELETIEGEKIVEKNRIEEKQTMPPRRFTPASIITELERKNLGTKSTRANIIETLYNRNYIQGQSIEATPLGISLIKSLVKYSPIIIDEELTRHFEKEMDSIQRAKKNLFELEKNTLDEAKKSIKEIAEDFKKKEDKIGKELMEANKENYQQEREANTLTLCPNCKKGNLRIIYNKKSQRYFIGCSSYPECKTTFSLPPFGLMKNAEKNCETCGFSKVLAIRKGKRPWEFCFNPNCKSNEEWAKRSSETKEN